MKRVTYDGRDAAHDNESEAKIPKTVDSHGHGQGPQGTWPSVKLFIRAFVNDELIESFELLVCPSTTLDELLHDLRANTASVSGKFGGRMERVGGGSQKLELFLARFGNRSVVQLIDEGVLPATRVFEVHLSTPKPDDESSVPQVASFTYVGFVTSQVNQLLHELGELTSERGDTLHIVKESCQFRSWRELASSPWRPFVDHVSPFSYFSYVVHASDTSVVDDFDNRHVQIVDASDEWGFVLIAFYRFCTERNPFHRYVIPRDPFVIGHTYTLFINYSDAVRELLQETQAKVNVALHDTMQHVKFPKQLWNTVYDYCGLVLPCPLATNVSCIGQATARIRVTETYSRFLNHA